jgi:very-short-patch-repair endonuclease
MPRNMTEGAQKRARSARKEPSVAEKLMWKRLRNGKTGFKFRREHPVGPYRLDFFCFEAMLAVEMDGEQHDSRRDAVRDKAMLEQGILTYRISNLNFFGLNDEPYGDETAEIIKLCEERSGRKADASS